MAQTLTNLSGQIDNVGGPPAGSLKLGSLNVVNGAGETSISVDWSTYGIDTVVCYGMTAKDTWTNTGGPHAALTGTTVVYNWIAADLAAAVVWALGF
jgi:hypothetical protein